MNNNGPEQQEEKKLMEKYPELQKKTSANLHMRKINNRKYFDSGDWNILKRESDEGSNDTGPVEEEISIVRAPLELGFNPTVPRGRKISVNRLSESDVDKLLPPGKKYL